MTVEVLPLGTKCNLSCQMCYQNPIREAGNQAVPRYNMAAMKNALEKEGYRFTVFGGEPLLMPMEDLSELWRWGMERFGSNSVQTSATCVTEKHFDLFKRYRVHVGVSLEGPGKLNDIRWAGSLEKTRELTGKAEEVLFRLLKEGIPCSLITTLNRGNASSDRLPVLLEWYRKLDSAGLRSVNLHLLQVDNEFVREKWSLTEDENVQALLSCADLQSDLSNIRFQPISDMTQLLVGRDNWDGGGVSCIWNACDPYTTRAVRGVTGSGSLVNCSRTNKNGVDMEKSDTELFIRPLTLFYVDQDKGGCKGCRFWFACKGHCPGEAINGDWRMKTEHCGVLMRVFSELEKRLSSIGLRPISKDESSRRKVEERLLSSFRKGEFTSISAALGGHKVKDREHGDAPHGDIPHGDHDDVVNPVITHGDHTDVL